MTHPFEVDDVMRPKPTTGQLLWRGFRKQCPRCGTGHLYDGWFKMKERCPGCGVRFEREPGFFVGAYLINFAIVEGFLFVLLMGYVFWKNSHPEAGVMGPVVAGVLLGTVVPVIFYPFSRTIWSAIDIAMTPLELDEIVAAADATDEPSAGAGVSADAKPKPGASEDS